MLEKVIWDNSLQDWGISLLIVLGAFVVMKLLLLIIRKVLKPLSSKTKSRIDDVIFDSLESPVQFGVMLIGIWVALHRLDYPEAWKATIDKSYTILIILTITWFFARLFNGLLDQYMQKEANDKSKGNKNAVKMMPMVKRTLLVLTWIIGALTALSHIGIEVKALLGALGIGGIAFALAAQDTIKNIFGAFILLTDRPFNIGDTVKIDSFEGTIVDIGIRSTKMRDYNKRLITFPNSKISDASIVNITAEPMRRVVMKLGLTYDTTSEKMEEAMTLLREMPTRVQFVSPKNLKAYFSEFGDSAMVITFIFFIEKKGDNQTVTSNVNMDILSTFNKAGLNFAFPSQTVYIEK